MAEEDHREHNFWGGQPVVQSREERVEPGLIYRGYTPENTRQNPHSLVAGFSWHEIDLTQPDKLDELYNFLLNNYVVHPKSNYAFAYTKEFLDWCMHPPGWKQLLQICVRSDKTQKMVGFICALPVTIRCYDDVRETVAVDFLSIHKNLRGKNLAPLLIMEITRRVKLLGIQLAVYTAGKKITEPIVKTRYYHRIINFEKLVRIKFTSLLPNENMKKQIRAHQLRDSAIKIQGFRELIPEDIPQVTQKLNEYLKKYPFTQVFTEEEAAYNFLPKPNIIGSYVIDNGGDVEAFCSFYMVPSVVHDCPEYSSYIAAYIYYYYARPTQMEDLIKATMFMAHTKYSADVFNCLDIFDNNLFIPTLNFVKGDGSLHYYLYNYAMPKLNGAQCGITLL